MHSRQKLRCRGARQSGRLESPAGAPTHAGRTRGPAVARAARRTCGHAGSSAVPPARCSRWDRARTRAAQPQRGTRRAPPSEAGPPAQPSPASARTLLCSSACGAGGLSGRVPLARFSARVAVPATRALPLSAAGPCQPGGSGGSRLRPVRAPPSCSRGNPPVASCASALTFCAEAPTPQRDTARGRNVAGGALCQRFYPQRRAGCACERPQLASRHVRCCDAAARCFVRAIVDWGRRGRRRPALGVAPCRLQLGWRSAGACEPPLSVLRCTHSAPNPCAVPHTHRAAALTRPPPADGLCRGTAGSFTLRRPALQGCGLRCGAEGTASLQHTLPNLRNARARAQRGCRRRCLALVPDLQPVAGAERV